MRIRRVLEGAVFVATVPLMVLAFYYFELVSRSGLLLRDQPRFDRNVARFSRFFVWVLRAIFRMQFTIEGTNTSLEKRRPCRCKGGKKTASGRRSPAPPLAERSALLRAFLDTCDFPRFELRTDRTLIVEDVKWWLELPFRPLAVASRVDDQGAPTSPRQSAMSDRGPTGTPERPPLEDLGSTPLLGYDRDTAAVSRT